LTIGGTGGEYKGDVEVSFNYKDLHGEGTFLDFISKNIISVTVNETAISKLKVKIYLLRSLCVRMSHGRTTGYICPVIF
jgi:hypothetical protein